VTYATRCIICGGAVVEWDEYTAKCIGWCGSKQERLEDMTPAQRTRMFKIVQRALAIEQASDVDVKGDVL
jgi:hypothetical protein